MHRTASFPASVPGRGGATASVVNGRVICYGGADRTGTLFSDELCVDVARARVDALECSADSTPVEPLGGHASGVISGRKNDWAVGAARARDVAYLILCQPLRTGIHRDAVIAVMNTRVIDDDVAS